MEPPERTRPEAECDRGHVIISTSDIHGVEVIQRGLHVTEPWTEEFADEMRARLEEMGALFLDPKNI